MVPFLVDTIEEILRDFCGRFILSDVMSKAVKTVDLIKISILDITIHKPRVDLGFALRHDIGVLKNKGTISDTQIASFKEDAKNLLANLANHIATKTPIQSYFARCTRSLNPIYMVEDPDACKRLFDRILAKLVSTKHFSSEFPDEYKQQYSAFLQIIVKADKAIFLNFDIDSTRLGVFLMGYMKDNVRFSKLVDIFFLIGIHPVQG